MSSSRTNRPKPGRPKAGTEAERLDYLLDQALNLFIHEGFGNTSIAKIAATAGVSTRTIYEHFKNKSELLLASVGRMVETDVSELSAIPGLSQMTLAEGLKAMSEILLRRILHPDMIAFHRMVVAESAHLPKINDQMKQAGPLRIQGVIAEFIRQHAEAASLPAQYIDRAAALFLEMLFGEPQKKALFGCLEAEWDQKVHVDFVVKIFLNGLTGTKP